MWGPGDDPWHRVQLARPPLSIAMYKEVVLCEESVILLATVCPGTECAFAKS